ncbi:hypothetical protein SynBIOSE41_03962 [Synechococcus sp. BIOS-E4-1]|nr:hypothetical protein SynBIOSE41_03962 [Synechococcus sp. BIOS-E4-1]
MVTTTARAVIGGRAVLELEQISRLALAKVQTELHGDASGRWA